jgi:site-specific DNA recombinase
MRVAIYARVSTLRQAQTQTIEQQLERLVGYVSRQGWDLPADNIFRDDGRSGASLNRPGLDNLRDRIAAREIDCLVITAPDRLARNYVHQMVLLEEWEKYGCQVEFLDHPISQDPHDQLVLQIRGAVAEYERTLIADRMRRGRQAKYRAGVLLPWTKPVYGYQTDPDKPRDPAKVTINTAEAAVIREMFAYYLQEDTSLYGLVKHLYEMGIPAPEGGEYWNTTTVRGILTNPAYLGQVYLGRTRMVQPQKRRSATHPVGRPFGSHTQVAPEDWTPVATIPAIVDQEQFDLIKTKMSRNKQLASRNNTVHHYLLRNLVSCAVCNLSCTARQLHPGYTYYVCRGKYDVVYAHVHGRCTARYIPAQQLDDLVWNDLCQILMHPEIITAALHRAQGGAWLPQELQARRENLRLGRIAFQTQLERLTEAYLNGVIPLPEYQRRRADLDSKRQGLEDLEKQLDNQVDRQKELIGLAASVEDFCGRVHVGLENASFEQKRKLVELLIDRVIVKNGEVEIRYVIPTSFSSEFVHFCHLRKDYFDPHPASIIGQSHAAIGQIGCQTPGLFFAAFPMRQQIHRVDLALCQATRTQPNAITRLLNKVAKALPTLLFIQPNLGIGFLPQNIEPPPDIQLAQNFHRSEFSITNQENGSSLGDQLAHIGQQSQLLTGSTMAANMFSPSPGDRNGSLPIGQTNDQQLVSKTNFRAIHDQTNLSDIPKLGFQPLPGNRLVPRSHSNGWVIQQSAQSPRGTRQFRFSRNLAGYFTHTHRTTQINSDHQPYKRPNLGDPLSWTQFHNSHFPGIIKLVDRHWVTPFRKMFSQNDFTGDPMPVNYSAVKLSGS